MRTAKELIGTFDTIGNRTQTQAGGDQNGANLRVAGYTNNTLNQITSRGAPGYVDVMGDALATNSVTVNGQTAYRKNEYYRQQLSVANTSAAVWQSVTNASPGQTSVTGNAYVAKTPETYTYDADGNLLSDGRWTYSWDAENRLTTMTSLTGAPSGSQLSLSFVYDYRGRRIQKLVSTNSGSAYVGEYTNNYIYDGWNCLAILNPSFGLVESFMWGSDLSGRMQGAGGVGGLIKVTYYGSTTTNCFVAFDGNGNVSALVNAANGVTAANYDYGPFGELIRASGPMAKLNPFRFSTKYDDDETDLLYYGHRYYNPSTGRWLSRDPVGKRGGRNLYDFVSNSPENLIDPLGAFTWSTTVDDAANLDDFLDACDKLCFKFGPFNNSKPCYCYCWKKFPPTPRIKTRNQLIAEWLALNPTQTWPTDPIKGSSQPHHIQPLADRGAGDGSNIDPMFADDHTKHHQDDGDFKRWGRRGGRTCTASDPLDQE
jgi:RHS repeat-associated protein